MSEETVTAATLSRIAIVGSGLALRMTAATLARHLPPSIQTLGVNCEDAPTSDLFLGSITAPTAYAFNLAAGVTEPRLLLDTATSFSWGTTFSDWGAAQRSWVQCFHLPLPVHGGVQFHHYLALQGVRKIEPVLVSAVAARHGVFAHPLEKGSQPLARGEYGYQFDAQSYQAPFAAAARAGNLQVIAGKLGEVEIGDNGIEGLRLADGQVVRAGLYVDCSGPQGLLISRLDAGFRGGRRIRAIMSRRETPELGPPCRHVKGGTYGWQSDTFLQGTTARLTVFDAESEAQALVAHGAEPQITSEVTLGRYSRPWAGNCVAVGQAAGVLEPITHAPMLLLQRDIERLASLIPFTADMSMERGEYNRQCDDDYTHAELFNRALFETAAPAGSGYWRAAVEEPMSGKLAVKIAQFTSRGLPVAFDLEPFTAEDWTIQHFGLGRWPERHDRVADRASDLEVQQWLASRRKDIEQLVQRMPSHHRYVTHLAQHLRHQLQVVVVDPHDRTRGRDGCGPLGELLVHGDVRAPPLLLELRREDRVVVQRPQGGVGEPVVEAPGVVLGEGDRLQVDRPVAERLDRLGGSGPADPGGAAAADRRLQRGHEPAGALHPRPAAAVRLVIVGEPMEKPEMYVIGGIIFALGAAGTWWYFLRKSPQQVAPPVMPANA